MRRKNEFNGVNWELIGAILFSLAVWVLLVWALLPGPAEADGRTNASSALEPDCCSVFAEEERRFRNEQREQWRRARRAAHNREIDAQFREMQLWRIESRSRRSRLNFDYD